MLTPVRAGDRPDRAAEPENSGAKSADARQRFLDDLVAPNMGRPCRLFSNGNVRLAAPLDLLRPEA